MLVMTPVILLSISMMQTELRCQAPSALEWQ